MSCLTQFGGPSHDSLLKGKGRLWQFIVRHQASNVMRKKKQECPLWIQFEVEMFDIRQQNKNQAHYELLCLVGGASNTYRYHLIPTRGTK